MKIGMCKISGVGGLLKAAIPILIAVVMPVFTDAQLQPIKSIRSLRPNGLPYAKPERTRTYVGDFVFENDTLAMVNFQGGYFDSRGLPHYRHTDWQGNVTMVTDRAGQLVQHTGYYPYGEPWREPTGQPYLFGGKERLRENALNEYDFAARRYHSALSLWTTPDPKSDVYGSINPYTYCSSNPVRYIDPSGCTEIYTGSKGNTIKWIGSDGISNGKMAIVDRGLAKTIIKATKNVEFYTGIIENSENMAVIPSCEDMQYAQGIMEEANEAEVEMGASKDSKGVIQKWDNGGEVSLSEDEITGNIIGRHSIASFTKNGHTIPDRIMHKWDFHVYPINSKYENFGSSKPSERDIISDKENRKWSYKGTSFILGGKDGNVSFYYNDNIICTVKIEILIDKLKELQNNFLHN